MVVVTQKKVPVRQSLCFSPALYCLCFLMFQDKLVDPSSRHSSLQNHFQDWLLDDGVDWCVLSFLLGNYCLLLVILNLFQLMLMHWSLEHGKKQWSSNIKMVSPLF